MKITFGQHQQQKQVQAMAPRMIHAMEILKLPQEELLDKIEQELIENPILERKETEEAGDTPERKENDGDPRELSEKELVLDDDKGSAEEFERLTNLQREFPDHFDGPRPSLNRIQESSDRHHDMIANVASRGVTLQDDLNAQLNELDLEETLKKMCERIISSLSPDDGARLRVSLDDLLPPDATDLDRELAEEALATVQSLEPAGIAARNLEECLLLQLTPEIEHVDRVHKLIVNHLEDLQHNRLPQIQKATGWSIDEINEAWEELRTLDPKPASHFVEAFVPTVTPDLVVTRDEEGKYHVHMDEGPARSLNISQYYLQRIRNGQATDEEKEFIKKKLNAAQWLIESIEQRRSTLMKVTTEIVEHQRNFLEKGPEYIEPLKMQQIADRVGVHVTTVSRAVENKYVETPRGILALRGFFVGGTTSVTGKDVAWNKIQIELKKLIDGEDKAKPYSDDEIVKRLRTLGFTVARRTVTKYREKLNIPSSRQRRDWSSKKKS